MPAAKYICVCLRTIEHLLSDVFLDYSGKLSLTFSNPGYFGGFCALLFPILYGRALNGEKRYMCVLDGVLTGGLLFCLIMSGSSGALYAAAAATAAETVFLIVRKKRR
ncbi:hypothetical protein H6A65_11620 [Mediterraneibacter glycyrrhizinilyticus]|uniref:hypothetical protein n=1 Tax=Mediterraneibacter glycyrrhizinilyticus TaxID=342942 RepID=UPI00195F6312|nr:hypothetical protein [Mediterraneibacter glycyrrhizinilyticus]MBM6752137.1 hypothetical protein [Mediterraneibacter glycyrrhizinilyticus]